MVRPPRWTKKHLTGLAASGGEGRVRQVRDFKFGDRAPKAFEVIKAAGLLGKDVQDETAEIEQSPFGQAPALAMLRFALELLVEHFFHLAADRLDLRRAEAGTNHEKLCERAKSG